MASMNLDPSTALAEKYKGNRQVLQSAVLGQSTEGNIDPYSALRALQKLNVADRYEMMQKAMAGQPNPPSIAQQTVLAAQSAGLPAMPVPEETFGMAGGGLVAFAGGGTEKDATEDAAADAEVPANLTPQAKAQILQLYTQAQQAEQYARKSGNKTKSEDLKSTMQSLKDIMSEGMSDEEKNYYASTRKKLDTMEAERTKGLEQQKGLAALQAAAALSQGSDPLRGLTAAGAAFGQSYGQAVSAADKEKRDLMNMQIALADAQRKENLGLYKSAASIEASKAKAAQDAINTQINAIRAQGALAKGLGTTPKVSDAEQQIETLTQTYIRTGYTPAAAKEMATREFLTSRAGIAGTTSVYNQAQKEVADEWIAMGPTKQNELIAKYGSEEGAKNALLKNKLDAYNAALPRPTPPADSDTKGKPEPSTPGTTEGLPKNTIPWGTWPKTKD